LHYAYIGHIHEGYGIYKDSHTTYLNASILDENYVIVNRPVLFDMSPDLSKCSNEREVYFKNWKPIIK